MQPLQLLEMKRQLQCKLPVPCLNDVMTKEANHELPIGLHVVLFGQAGSQLDLGAMLRNDSSALPMSTSELKLWMVWCKRSQSFLSGGGRRRSREPQMDTICANLFKSKEALPFGRFQHAGGNCSFAAQCGTCFHKHCHHEGQAWAQSGGQTEMLLQSPLMAC